MSYASEIWGINPRILFSKLDDSLLKIVKEDAKDCDNLFSYMFPSFTPVEEDKDLVEFLKNATKFNPKERASAEELLQINYLQGSGV